MNSTDISVLMSVYNTEKYLVEAIESILNQSFNNFEFIIINDGSTDRSEDILRYYERKDKRIKLISRENRGLVLSLNEALDCASASLIARMDADDISLPQRFEEQIKYLKDNPDVVCVGTAQIIIDEDGDELTRLNVPTENSVIQKRLLEGHCPLEHPSVMFRTDAVKALGAYRKDCEAAEDYDLWLRLGEVGKLANINKPLIQYRYLSSSVSAANQTKQKESTKKACFDAWERRGVTGEYKANSEWRASQNRLSKLRFTLKFGWWAYNYQNRAAAIKYAKRAIRLAPWCIEAWKLLLLSIKQHGS
ncbi:glycosyltransferase [Methylophaga thalassica]|uniref:glycosyltransferase n=1 Tax=Methylophaga thalassica TaxID=40223 RepID=UPI002E7BA89C|nr:glycosyltransferase [Methylophaga thalassica]WVI84744.1 glycosyltransferase [Methylophaga thalassica]